MANKCISKPLMSVIIPAYNLDNYIGDCLNSVRLASERCGKKIEIICVDDGSSDNTWKKICSFAEGCSGDNNHNVCAVTIRQENSGVSAARNVALEVASGDWICFVDADDLISPDIFVECLAAIEKHPSVDFISYGVAYFADGTNWTGTNSAGASRLLSSSVKHLESGLDAKCIETGICGGVYRRSTVGSLRFDTDMANAEDRVFYGRFLLQCRRTCEIRRELYGYRQRNGSADHSDPTPKSISDIARGWMLRLEMAASDKRPYAASSIRWFALMATEGFADRLSCLSRTDRAIAYKRWLAAIECVLPLCSSPCLNRPPFWNRFVFRICHATRSMLVLWVLCLVPYRLKRMGLHRR